MGQSSKPDVAVNKDYAEYEERGTEMAGEAWQILQKCVPG